MENTDDFKKFFDKNEYITKIIGANDDAPTTKKAKVATLISLLTDPANKDVKEETLLALKKEKAGSLLIDAIKQNKLKNKKHILVAACWESEINFSNELTLFIDLACDADYFISLEAITTIDTMEGPFNELDVKEGIHKVKAEQKKLNTEKVVLLNDLVVRLEGFLK